MEKCLLINAKFNTIIFVIFSLVINGCVDNNHSERNNYEFLSEIAPAPEGTTLFAGNEESKLLGLLKRDLDEKHDTIIIEKYYTKELGDNALVTEYSLKNKSTNQLLFSSFTCHDSVKLMIAGLDKIRVDKQKKFAELIKSKVKLRHTEPGAFINPLSDNRESMMILIKSEVGKDSVTHYGITWHESVDYLFADGAYKIVMKQMMTENPKIKVSRIE